MMNTQYLLGDDQDLDDRVIKKLWEENQELRNQVYQMKSFNPKNDEGNICKNYMLIACEYHDIRARCKGNLV